MQPLIITALLEESAQARFDELRRLHFPPERNYLGAHVTLFHALPGEHKAVVCNDARDACINAHVEVEVAGLMLLGGGVAFKLRSSALMEMRSSLAEKWSEWLTPQDRTKRELHITVQNKVDAEVAHSLHDDLSKTFQPKSVPVVGLGVWRYLDGPWEPVERFEFGPVS